MPRPVLSLAQIISKEAIYRLPRVVAFNRLEARPRTLEFNRSLRAEMRDPLWMLTRQWQFGEFQGEDAASAVTSRIAYQHESINRVALRSESPFTYEKSEMPLETQVERERIPLTIREKSDDEVYSDVLFAVQWGKQLLRMLNAPGLGGHYPMYLMKFPIRVWPPPAPAGHERTVEDADAEQVGTSIEGRIADGVAVWRAVQRGTHDAWLDSQAVGDTVQLKTVVAAFAQSCSKKLKRLFAEPENVTDSAWLPNRLEYQFSVSGQSNVDGVSTLLRADQYHDGHLDWYSFDASESRGAPRPAPPTPATEQVESFLPARIRFKGQPQPRYWEMEETQTDFGKIDTSTTGLLHLMLAEFGLIYSTDWFMLPHPMDVNTVCEIRGILVDDTFGRHTFIRAAGRGPETLWQRWSMFHLTDKARQSSVGNRFYLSPAAGKILESEPLERVNFVRDEMSNMAWAVETVVPSQTGCGRSGDAPPTGDGAQPKRTSVDTDVKIAYELGTTVPKNWIPFIASHAEGSISEIRLQRARMVGGEPPRGRLLREPGSPYFVEEEEVPRSGIYVERRWQRARWIGGRVVSWVGRRKTAGRGEAWSQLAFDQIIDLQAPSDQ
jgi:hypothetical protein